MWDELAGQQSRALLHMIVDAIEESNNEVYVFHLIEAYTHLQAAATNADGPATFKGAAAKNYCLTAYKLAYGRLDPKALSKWSDTTENFVWPKCLSTEQNIPVNVLTQVARMQAAADFHTAETLKKLSGGT